MLEKIYTFSKCVNGPMKNHSSTGFDLHVLLYIRLKISEIQLDCGGLLSDHHGLASSKGQSSTFITELGLVTYSTTNCQGALQVQSCQNKVVNVGLNLSPVKHRRTC